MISVIIPTYNRLALTQRAIASVLAQTYTDIEVLVVDDASDQEPYEPPPGTDPRVRVVRHPVNRGIAAARNTGAENARGEMVAYLDSDDYWFPEKLRQQLARFEKQPDCGKVLAYSAYYYEKDGRWLPSPRAFLAPGQSVGDYLFIDCGDIHTSTWLGRRDLFLQFPSFEGLKRHQDWDMLLRMEAGGVRFVACPELLGVRSADLMGHRLSTAPVHEMRALFLERNAPRMTPAARVVREADNASAKNPQWNFLQRQGHQLWSYLTSSLTPGQKASLIFRYARARSLNLLHGRLHAEAPRT